jgi:hypothetical protein
LIVFDVKSAYKNILSLAADIHLSGESHPQHPLLIGSRAQWGFTNAGWSWCDAAKIFAAILVFWLQLLILHYVDDYLGLIPPLPSGKPNWQAAFAACRDIQAIADLLGLTLAKWQLGLRVVYLGYLIDSSSMSVTLPAVWSNRCVDDLSAIVNRSASTVKQLRSAIGCLVRLSSVFPVAKSYLAPLFKLFFSRADKGGDAAWVRIPKSVISELSTLLLLIAPLAQEGHDLALCFALAPHDVCTLFSDASGSHAAWLFPRGRSLARHRWTPEEIDWFTVESRISMPAMEAFAAVAAATAGIQWLAGAGSEFASLSRFRPIIRIRIDSLVFLQAVERRYSPSIMMNYFIRLILSLSSSIELSYIHTLANPADIPTRSQAPPLECRVKIDGVTCVETASNLWPTLPAILRS